MLTGLFLLLVAVGSGDHLLVAGQRELYEGSPCTTSKGPGVCQLLDEKCQSVYRELQSGKPPEVVCGYRRNLPIICCPGNHAPNSASTTGRPIWGFGDQTTKSTSGNFWGNNRPTTSNDYWGNRPTTTGGNYWDNNRPTTTTPRRPTTSRNPFLNARPARRMCAEYAKSVYALVDSPALIAGDRTLVNDSLCAIKNKKLIVGGTKAEPKEFPHSAAIGYRSGSTVRWDCGGTLISDTFVLTAAHCLYSSQWGSPQLVRVGDLNLQRQNDNAKPQDRRIAEMIRHPNYKRPAQYNDIALLRLASPVTFDAHVRPACLDLRSSHPVGERVVATGWGTTEFLGERGTDYLLKVTLPIVSHEVCKREYSSDLSRLANGILDDSQLCAGQNQKDTCQGDSGGPLAVYSTEEECMYDVIGVTSFGASCGLSSGVYTRVFHFLPWIESVVWPNLG